MTREQLEFEMRALVDECQMSRDEKRGGTVDHAQVEAYKRLEITILWTHALMERLDQKIGELISSTDAVGGELESLVHRVNDLAIRTDVADEISRLRHDLIAEVRR